jgi:hypothetical protein
MFFAPEKHPAGCFFDESGHAVDDGGFAGSVGPDDAQDFTLVQIEADLVQGPDAAEGFGHIP